MRLISHKKNTHLGESCVTMTDLMKNFYEKTEWSDVICEGCFKTRGTTSKEILKKNSTEITNATKNISSRSNFNFEKNEFCKNKIKIALPAQYSMFFPDNPEVLYIIVYINLHIGNDMDQVHYA